MDVRRARAPRKALRACVPVAARFPAARGAVPTSALALRAPSSPSSCARCFRLQRKPLPRSARLSASAVFSASIARSAAVRCSSAVVWRAAASSACSDSACSSRRLFHQPRRQAAAVLPCGFQAALARSRSWKPARPTRASPLRASQSARASAHRLALRRHARYPVRPPGVRPARFPPPAASRANRSAPPARG